MQIIREEKLSKGRKGEIVLGNRIFSLAWADYVVLISEEEEGLRLIERKFEEHIRENDL